MRLKLKQRTILASVALTMCTLPAFADDCDKGFRDLTKAISETTTRCHRDTRLRWCAEYLAPTTFAWRATRSTLMESATKSCCRSKKIWAARDKFDLLRLSAARGGWGKRAFARVAFLHKVLRLINLSRLLLRTRQNLTGCLLHPTSTLGNHPVGLDCNALPVLRKRELAS